MMRLRPLPLAALLGIAIALGACGNLRAPSMSSPGDAATAPVDPNMGRVVDGRYVVAPGDTLATISARSNTPIRSLIDLNRLQPPYAVRPGQRLLVEARRIYVVKAGDSVYALAERFQVSQSAIVSLNHLTPPYRLAIGQQLTLPAGGENAPASATAAPLPAKPKPQPIAAPLPSPTASAPAGKPQPGAKPLIPTAAPAANSAPLPNPAPIADPAPVAATPQPIAAPPTIIEPTAIPDPDEPVAAPLPAPSVTQPQSTPALPSPTAPSAPAPEPVAASAPEPAPELPSPQSVGKAGFIWPADGRVISKFGATADGLRNDGINIAAPAGAPVRAAGDGVVAYAGSQLRGFGNLILLRHDNGYITAYAHNQSLLVAKGDKIKRGQVIARVGSTGNVAKPQLHFEIRKGETPVDPLAYLAKP